MVSDLLSNLPEIESPKKRIPFNQKLMWSGIALVLYYVLAMIPLYGISPTAKTRFEAFSILLAAEFGSLISLGIGPIVTASIILQLLVGAQIIKIDTKTRQGRRAYQGMQKLFSIFFIIFQNILYVTSGALPPATNSFFNYAIVILQLILGGFIILFLDEIVSKWGFGSGISLFIAAGVSRQIFVKALNPFVDPSTGIPFGAIPQSIMLLIQGFPSQALWPLIAVGATVLIFVISTYVQAIKVEIPLSFGRIRGFGIRWPLKFVYTSNIPVILTASFIATLQFWGYMMYKSGFPILGTYENVTTAGGYREYPASGLVRYLDPPTIRKIILYGFSGDDALSLIVYTTMMIIGSIIFSVLWINIGGQDPSTVAEQIVESGLSRPGFRCDKRILEKLLKRYIMPLTILGGATVASLAVLADIFGALSRGTGILLSVMIIYQLYEQISRERMEEMHPLVRKFLGKG